MFASLLLVAATHRAPLALLHHLSEQLAVFGFIAMRSLAATFVVRAVKTMLTPFSVDMTAVRPRGMSTLETSLAFVDMIRGHGPIAFKAVILLAGLMGIVFLVDAATARVAQPAAGNTMGAGLFDFMGAVLVVGVHRLILAAVLWQPLCRTYHNTLLRSQVCPHNLGPHHEFSVAQF
jgi:hypothetical protein